MLHFYTLLSTCTQEIEWHGIIFPNQNHNVFQNKLIYKNNFPGKVVYDWWIPSRNLEGFTKIKTYQKIICGILWMQLHVAGILC